MELESPPTKYNHLDFQVQHGRSFLLENDFAAKEMSSCHSCRMFVVVIQLFPSPCISFLENGDIQASHVSMLVYPPWN